jgi:hypothetical protein
MSSDDSKNTPTHHKRSCRTCGNRRQYYETHTVERGAYRVVDAGRIVDRTVLVTLWLYCLRCKALNDYQAYD